MLQLKNETTGHVALEISGGGALIGIDGASDSVHILAICGNPIIKSTKVIYDSRVVATSGKTTFGTATLDSSGNASITHGQTQPVIVQGVSNSIQDDDSTRFSLRGPANGTRKYNFW
jgi:hypothetical protein